VLQVAVHGEDELTGCVVKSGGKGRSLAEVAAELDNQDPGIDGSNLLQELVGAVAGAVIYQDQLIAAPDVLHNLLEAGIEGSYVLVFIVKGNYDGILRHT
jgi:hypothetical protein